MEQETYHYGAVRLTIREANGVLTAEWEKIEDDGTTAGRSGDTTRDN